MARRRARSAQRCCAIIAAVALVLVAGGLAGGAAGAFAAMNALAAVAADPEAGSAAAKGWRDHCVGTNMTQEGGGPCGWHCAATTLGDGRHGCAWCDAPPDHAGLSRACITDNASAPAVSPDACGGDARRNDTCSDCVYDAGNATLVLGACAVGLIVVAAAWSPPCCTAATAACAPCAPCCCVACACTGAVLSLSAVFPLGAAAVTLRRCEAPCCPTGCCDEYCGCDDALPAAEALLPSGPSGGGGAPAVRAEWRRRQRAPCLRALLLPPPHLAVTAHPHALAVACGACR